jgi:hypothetical protein
MPTTRRYFSVLIQKPGVKLPSPGSFTLNFPSAHNSIIEVKEITPDAGNALLKAISVLLELQPPLNPHTETLTNAIPFRLGLKGHIVLDKKEDLQVEPHFELTSHDVVNVDRADDGKTSVTTTTRFKNAIIGGKSQLVFDTIQLFGEGAGGKIKIEDVGLIQEETPTQRTMREVKERLLQWLNDDGMKNTAIDDPQTDFHFAVDLKGLLLDLFKPRNKADLIVVQTGIRLSPNQLLTQKQMKRDELDELLFELKSSLLLSGYKCEFQNEVGSDSLEFVYVRQYIRFDGLTKQSFMDNTDKVVSGWNYLALNITRVFGSQ